MKKQILLTLANPCHEKWEGLTQTKQGGFCTSCSKVVVDFSKMNDAEIVDYFSNRPHKTCGRFRSDQLRVYSTQPLSTLNPGFTLLKAGLLSLLLVMVSEPGSAQTTQEKSKTEVAQGRQADQNQPGKSGLVVRGVVKVMDDGEALAGVNIWLKGSEEGTVSDANGKFEFPRPLKAGEVLVFSFIGLETAEYVVSNDAKDVFEVSLDMALTSNVMLGEVSVDDVYTAQPSGLRRLWTKVKGIF